MLAPVLARLDAIPGVTSARVDSSGRYFWIALDEAADAPRVTALADAVLGAGARPLSGAQAEAQLAARLRGDPWLGAGEVMTLSFVEARLLSVRLGAEAAQRVGATAEQREILGEAIRAELFAVMERVHAEGGRSSGGWIHQEWPAIAAAIVERCARPIPTTLRAKLAQELPALLAR